MIKLRRRPAMKRETPADIIKEWRDMVCYCESDVHPLNHATVVAFLDRLEAAAKRDEALIASLLYYHAEDFAEAVASERFTRVIKAAYKRLGLKYEPFGLDALETVEKRRKEVSHD